MAGKAPPLLETRFSRCVERLSSTGVGRLSSMPASLSKKRRSLERLLNKPGLSDQVRHLKQKELDQLTGQATKQRKIAREKLNSKKYHKVRFFERRKCDRRIAHLTRQISQPHLKQEERDSLSAELQEARHDLLYVQHFPRNKKYLSLFPGQGADNPVISKMRVRMRSRIIRMSERGTLPESTVDVDDDETSAAMASTKGESEFFGSLENDEFFAGGSDSD